MRQLNPPARARRPATVPRLTRAHSRWDDGGPTERIEVRNVLTREQVLDELGDLATVAHALCVEYLFMECALGHGVDSPAGSPPPQTSDAAGAAHSLAVGQMRRLRAIDHLLTVAGRDVDLGRATELRRPAPTAAIAFAPLTAAQLDGMLEREHAMAAAVDARYKALQEGVEQAVVEELDGLAFIIDATDLAEAFGRLRDGLEALAPSAYLRAVRDVPADDRERGLRDLSDRYYAFVLTALGAGFAHPEIESQMVDNVAVGAMFAWDEVNKLLVQGGLLPAFTLP
jgi:hypothetical protein